MDTNEQKKAALKTSSERHKNAVNNDLKALVDKTEKAVGNTALTISVLLAAMAIYKIFKGKKKSSGISSRLLRTLKQQVFLYILNKGRSKIVDYINTFDETRS